MLRKPDFITARAYLADRMTPVETERVSLSEAAGRILAEDLIAADNIPPFDRSPFDGYAFRAADTAQASPEHPVTLTILEEVPAGAVPAKRVTPGTATKILTGAPIPEGADCVSMFERTEFTRETVTLFAPGSAGENIILAGEDVKKGTLLVRKGARIDAGVAGTLAAQGVSQPLVYRRVRVGIISTGNEVIALDKTLRPGKIYDSNRYMLEAAVMQLGMVPVHLGLIGDDADGIARLIEKGLPDCDVILLTGGVSVGDYDLTPAAIEQAGCEMLIRGASLKPGMACAIGMNDGKLVCGLSGNPASALTNYYAITLPALKKLAGYSEPIPREIEITLADSFGRKSKRTRLLRGKLDLSDGTVRMRLQPEQGNVVLSSAIGCDARAMVPEGSGPVPAGTKLKGFLL